MTRRGGGGGGAITFFQENEGVRLNLKEFA
jgi:hypothetical protein